MHCMRDMVSWPPSSPEFPWAGSLTCPMLTSWHCTGPCVLISPDEVSVSDVPSAKEIHRIGGNFLKAPWYGKFSQENFAEVDKGIFSMREPKVHSQRRKLFASGFSRNAILEWEDVIQQKVGMAISGIQREMRNKGSANILDWFTYMVCSLRHCDQIGGISCVVRT